MNSKFFVGVLVVFLALALVVGGFFIGTQRGLVSKQEDVKESWSQVEVQYQRRFDLIPNMVECVNKYMEHEKETLEAVIQARNSARVAQQSGNPQDYENANAQVAMAMKSLDIVVERYPDLKSNESINNLMLELSGTENRIANARENYNESVKVYTRSVKMFPTSMVASMMGFEDEFEYIKASKGAEVAPTLNFD